MYLLDVNVLIALLDQCHVNHISAHRWFKKSSGSFWATCPITENAVIRILSNPGYASVDWMPTEVMNHLDGFFTEELGWNAWSDDVSLQDETLFDRRLIRGHKQLTDIYLLGLAVRRGGKLATFDRSIPWHAIKGARASHLVLL